MTMALLDIRYQPAAHGLLQSGLARDRAPHAYIFHGPDGVGKRGTALGLARLLMCTSPQAPAGSGCPEYPAASTWRDGCGRCQGCRLCDSAAHPDVHVIHRQLIRFHDDQAVRGRKGVDLGVDVIRQFLIAQASRKAMYGGAKVFIVDEAERLSIQAQNALLKTLEEPPDQTTLILLARGLETMLPTTRSRCQMVRFGPLPVEFVRATIAQRCADLDEAGVWFAAHHEPGSLGRALEIAEGGYLPANDAIVEHLLHLDRVRTLTTAKAIQEQADALGKAIKTHNPDIDAGEATRQALRGLLAMIATFYRDVLSCACFDGGQTCNRGRQEAITQRAAQCGAGAAREAIEAVARAEGELRANANVLLVLEGLCIELARLNSVHAVGGAATIG